MDRPPGSARTSLIALTTLLVLAGCSAGDRDDERPPSANPTNGGDNATAKRPFRPLDADKPGGPRHRQPISAEPSREDLDEAARSEPTRLCAETFAIQLNHAIKDQTAGSQGDIVINEFSSGLPPDSVTSIEEGRSFPGNQVVPGARSFVRSTMMTRSSGTIAVVQVVEKVEVPKGNGPHKPFIYWAETILTVGRAADRWQLVDYQSAVASEYERFSNNTWRGVMDSGRDWRRFDVAETP